MNTRDTFRWDNFSSVRNHLRRRAHRPRRGPRPRSLRIEFLEDRRLLAETVAQWIGGSGNWSDPTNWDIGVVPSNDGAEDYSVVIDLSGSAPLIDVTSPIAISGLVNRESVRVQTGGSLTVSNSVTNAGDLTASGGILRFENAMVGNAGQTIAADGGTVELKDSTITGGSLRATDNAASFVQFEGDVTLNGVPWEDPGAGEFRVYNTSAKLLGDYAQQLPAGYTLVVASYDGAAAQLNLTGGVFQNDGTIELRLIPSQINTVSTLHLESDTTLTGHGQLLFQSDAAEISGASGVGLTIGAGQHLHGYGGYSQGIAVPVVNHGLIEADDTTQQFPALRFTQPVVNDGILRAVAGELMLAGGLSNTGVVELVEHATLSLSGDVNIGSNLTVGRGSTLRLANATVANAGRTIVADEGIVEIQQSTITGGGLRVTDTILSFVQFSGDVTLNGVSWDDPGAGEFRIYNTTARLLGDYARQLPAGCTLVVLADSANVRSEFPLPAGMFTNDGTIELRATQGWGERALLYLTSDSTLGGSGRVRMSGIGGGWVGVEGDSGATLTIGPQQTISGTGLTDVPVVNHGLIAADSTSQSHPLEFSQSVTNYGTLRADAGKLTLAGGLTNTGNIEIVRDATLTVSGDVDTTTNLTARWDGQLRFHNATVANTGHTITADGGIVEVKDSTITGGSLHATDDAASFVQFDGDVTLNGVSWEDPGAGEFRIYQTTARFVQDYAHGLPPGYKLVVEPGGAWGAVAQLDVAGGVYTNDGEITLRSGYASTIYGYPEVGPATLWLDGDVTLSGLGRVVMQCHPDWPDSCLARIDGPTGVRLTIEPEQSIEGVGSISISVTNRGLISANQDGLVLLIETSIDNQGTLSAVNGGTLSLGGDASMDDPGVLAGHPSGTFSVNKNLLGSDSRADRYLPRGKVLFDGRDPEALPQLLEVMAEDIGTNLSGSQHVLAYDALALARGAYVQLVDLSDNAAGAGAEAIYVHKLVVPSGATLDLNRLHLYACSTEVDGTVLNGTIGQLPTFPKVLGHSSLADVMPEVNGIRLVFDIDMNRTSFSLADVVSFTGPGGNIAAGGHSWTDARTLEIRFAPQTAVGTYRMVIGAQILDTAGTPLDQDNDFAVGETTDDQYTATFVITAPRITASTPTHLTSEPQEAIRFTFDRPMDQTSFSLAEDVVSFTGPHGAILASGYTWVDARTLAVTFPTQTAVGVYRMRIGPQIRDLGGNALDQDNDLIAGQVPRDQYAATFKIRYGGTLATDTTWGPHWGVIVVEDPLTIASGVTLTIQAGTIVKFVGSSAGIAVDGILNATGTTSQPVIFTSIFDDTVAGDTNGDGSASMPTAGDWDGIRFTNLTDVSSMTGVDVRYAAKSISVSDFGNTLGGNLRLSRAVLRNNKLAVESGAMYSQLTVENSLITRNAEVLEAYQTSGVVLRNCTITGNAYVGNIGHPVLTIENTIIAFNGRGLSGWPDPEDVEIRNSVVADADTAEFLIGVIGQQTFEQNANITADPLFMDRQRGNYELSPGSPAIDSGTGARSSTTDLLGRPRHDDLGMPNVGSGYPAFVDMGAYERQSDTAAPDLAVTRVGDSTPLFVVAGASFSGSWTVTNVGLSEAAGAWQDVVYLSADPYPSSDDEILAQRAHNGPLAPGESYTDSFTANAPTASGVYYLLVRTNAQQSVKEAVLTNNLAAARGVLGADLPVLTAGSPVTGTLRQGEWTYVRYEATADQSMIVNLDVAAQTGTTGLYARYGTAPTLMDYDVSTVRSSQPDQELRLLSPYQGSYFIGIFAGTLPGGASSYTLSITVPTLAIHGVWPNTVSSAASATLRIDGDNFDPAAQVQLVAPDGTVIEAQEYYQDPATLFATFDLAAAHAAPGTYDVVVVNPGPASVTRTDALTVEAAATPQFRASLVLPGKARPGRVVDVRIDYFNPGTVDVRSPILTLDSGQPDTEWQLPGSESWTVGPRFHVMGLSSSGPATILRAGQQESIMVRLRVPFRPDPVTVELWSIGAIPTDGSTTPIDWNKFETDVKPANIDADTWAIAFARLKTQVRPTWGDYAAALRRDADRWAAAGRRMWDVQILFAMETDQAFGEPRRILAGHVVYAGSGLPVADAPVAAWNADSHGSGFGLTDDTGGFVVYGLGPGDCQLTVGRHLAQSGHTLSIPEDSDLLGAQVIVTAAGRVAGTVVSFGDTAVVAGAIVSLTNAAGSLSRIAVTDETGRYEFAELPAGDYVVQCVADAYVGSEPQNAAVSLGETTWAHFVLAAGAAVSGTVTRSADGNPLPAAVIIAYGPNTGYLVSAQTDSHGAYRLRQLPADTYSVAVSLGGYVRQTTSDVVLAAGQTQIGLNFDLAPGAVITGSVVDAADSQPIEGASVILRSGEKGMCATTNASGRYLLDGIAPGQWRIVAVQGSYLTLDEYDVNVITSDPLLQDFQLHLGAQIMGTVTDVHGAPLPNVSVSAQIDGTTSRQAKTGDDGRYSIVGLADGDYTVRTQAAGFVAAALQTGALQTGQVREGADLQLAAASVVDGVVTELDGVTPIAGASVSLQGNAGPVYALTSAADGTFRGDELTPGVYYLSVQAEGHCGAQRVIEVPSGEDLHGLNITLSIGVSIAGIVTAHDGVTAVPNVEVLVQGSGGAIVDLVVTDDRGLYEFAHLPAGTYSVIALHDNYSFAPKQVQTQEAQSYTVDILAGSGRLHGVIRSESSGSPVAGARVIVVRKDSPDLAMSVTAGPDGQFALSGLLPQQYLLITGPESGYARRCQLVTIDPATDTELNIVLGESLTVQVQLVDATTGNPVSQATALLRDAQYASMDPGVAGTADLHGAYLIAGIPAGDFLLTVLADGYQMLQSPVSVSVSSEVTYYLNSEGNSVGGTVRDASTGNPLSNAQLLLYADGILLDSAASDPKGLASFGRLPPGTYTVTATAHGASVSQSLGVAGDTQFELSIPLGSQSRGRPALPPLELGGAQEGGALAASPPTASAVDYRTYDQVRNRALSYIRQIDRALLAMNFGSPFEPLPLIAPLELLEPTAETMRLTPIKCMAIENEAAKELQTTLERELKEIQDDMASRVPSLPDTWWELRQELSLAQLKWGSWETTKVGVFILGVLNLPISAHVALGAAVIATANDVYQTCRNPWANWTDPDYVEGVGSKVNRINGLLAKLLEKTQDVAQAKILQRWLSAGDIAYKNLRNWVAEVQGILQRLDDYTTAVGEIWLKWQEFRTGLERYNEINKACGRLTITWDPPSGGTATPAPAADHTDEQGSYYYFGTSVFVTATPAADYKFNYATVTTSVGGPWPLYSNPLELEIWGETTYTAHFYTEKQPDPNPGAGAGEPQGSGTIPIVTSSTPEDKWGPLGFDPPGAAEGSKKHFVAEGQTFEYRIEMWNKPEAPVPTQDATIYDYLDPDLFDLSTFEFTRVGFLKWDVPLPGGQSVKVRVDCRPDMNFAVDISGTFDPTTGRIDWWFHTIDPLTGDYPANPNDGFLPPFNPATGFEIGWMEFRVAPKADLATGTTIANQAFVQFEFLGPWGPAPKEGPWINTIDAGIPDDASRVKSLPSATTATSFLVEWSGADEPDGSGIASYDVYYREDDEDGNVDGQYQLWLPGTTATSASFPYGRPEHNYRFYVVATDNVGHREAAPLTADAQTAVGSALFRLGIAGDSLSDEYAEASYSYAHNWVESLAQDLDVGAQGTWGTPRDEGFEFNWAQAGATTDTLLADGQHTGLAQQITAGLIDYAVLAIGQNDFGPWTEAYLGIYSETWTPLQIMAYGNQVITNIETALQTLTATGGKVVLSNIIDYGVAPITRLFLTDPAGRERVTDVIRSINTELVRLVQQYNVPLIDGFQATKDFLGENAAPVDTVAVGGVEFVNAAGVEPQNMFVDDGIHPHTVGQAVIANLVVEAIRLGYGQDVGTIGFSEQEMLGLVGLGAQYTGDTLNLIYPDYIILPGPRGGITVSPISRPTTEPNGTAVFTIVLDTQPLADVTIALHSSDTSEGTVSPASVTFTPDNWNVAQKITVTGADDDLVDGTVAYTVVTEPAVSTDGRYSRVNAADVAVTNLDNDPHPWRNPRHWADTDDNGSITAGDVLVLINDINNKQSRSLPVPPPAGQWPPPFLDTDGDDAITPNDVIRIINDINNNGPRPIAGAASGEGEGGTMLAAGADVFVAIPGAELPRDLHALRADRAGVEESGPGDRGSVAARTVDDRWSSAANRKLAAAEQVARTKSVRDRILPDRLATDMERDEAKLLVGRSFAVEDALSEIASDIATARRCRAGQASRRGL